MSNDQPTDREMIDACRPGSDDVAMPEMSPLATRLQGDSMLRRAFERSQRLDAVLETVIRQGSVPDGLASRLLATVAGGEEARTRAAVVSDHPRAADELTLPVRRRLDRRAWTALAAGLVGVAAVIAAVVAWLPPNERPITEREIGLLVPTWKAAVEKQPWLTTGFPESFPPTRQIALARQGWQSITDGGITGQLVCYDLTPIGKGQVLLFVLQTNRRVQLPARPPARPLLDTQGLCVGAWKEQGLVYAIYVVGDARRYQQLIRLVPRIA